jgi:glycosyltransferase involved in cell wall biosynthesis
MATVRVDLSNMRILIYSHTFAPNIGGVETVAVSLAMGLAGWKQANGTSDVKVTVVTRTPGDVVDDESLPFSVMRQPSLLKLVRLIRRSDVIHLFGPAFLPMLVALLVRKPIVVEHCGFQVICPNGQLLHEPTRKLCPGHFMAGRHGECIRCNADIGRMKSVKLWLLTFPRRWLCALVQSNIMPTKWLGGILHLPRSTTVYHGLPDRGKRQLAASSSLNTTFAFVGRLVSTKGAQTLLQAAHQLEAEGFRFQLKMIGDGPDRGALQQQAVALGLGGAVEFLGYLPADSLEDHLMLAGTVVMPSLAGEVFGMVAAENMFRGKLLIVSDIGAMREVIGDAGLWFVPGDFEGLASCMRRVLNEPGLAMRLGRRARQRAQQLFSEERMVSEHLTIFRQLRGGSGRSTEKHGVAARLLQRPHR